MKNVFSLMRTGSRFGGDHIPVIISGGCLLFSLCTLDRAFITGYTFALLITIALHPAVKLSKRTLWITGAPLLLLPLLLAIGLKTGSSKGRLLIYKISATICRDHFPQGIGWGNFKAVYNNYQAAYFRKGTYSTTELLAADNTYFAFNDYFQWIIEGGWMAIAGMVIGAAFISLGIARNLRKGTTPLLNIAIAQLVAIMIAACFTHVFEKPLYQFVAVGAVSLLFLRWQYALIPALLVLLIYHAHYIRYYQDYQRLKEAQQLALAGNRMALLTTGEALYPAFRKEPEFLMIYGSMLLEMEEREKAPRILREACALRPTSTWLAKLGAAYELAGDKASAETTYLQAVYMVPNRFGAKMQLFTFYEQQGRREEMMHWGRIILQQPVKIPSAQVDRILQRVKQKMAMQ